MDNVKDPTIKILTSDDENTRNQNLKSFDKIIEEETEKCTKIVTRNRQQLELPKIQENKEPNLKLKEYRSSLNFKENEKKRNCNEDYRTKQKMYDKERLRIPVKKIQNLQSVNEFFPSYFIPSVR